MSVENEICQWLFQVQHRKHSKEKTSFIWEINFILLVLKNNNFIV